MEFIDNHAGSDESKREKLKKQWYETFILKLLPSLNFFVFNIAKPFEKKK